MVPRYAEFVCRICVVFFFSVHPRGIFRRTVIIIHFSVVFRRQYAQIKYRVVRRTLSDGSEDLGSDTLLFRHSSGSGSSFYLSNFSDLSFSRLLREVIASWLRFPLEQTTHWIHLIVGHEHRSLSSAYNCIFLFSSFLAVYTHCRIPRFLPSLSLSLSTQRYPFVIFTPIVVVGSFAALSEFRSGRLSFVVFNSRRVLLSYWTLVRYLVILARITSSVMFWSSERVYNITRLCSILSRTV